MARLLRYQAASYGFDVVEDISYSAQAPNVISEVLRLRQADPDVIVMSSTIIDALLFMQTFKEQNYFPRMVFGQRGGFMNSDFINVLQEDANYVFTTARWNFDLDREISSALAQEFREASGGIDLIGDVLANAWNAYLVALIINQAGSTDPEAMREVMRTGLNVNPEHDPTGLPGYLWDETGQNIHTTSVVVQMMDGTLHTVFPTAVAARDGVFPATPWNQR